MAGRSRNTWTGPPGWTGDPSAEHPLADVVGTYCVSVYDEITECTSQQACVDVVETSCPVLPAAVSIATPASASTTCGGTLTAPDGGGAITLSGDVGSGVAAGRNHQAWRHDVQTDQRKCKDYKSSDCFHVDHALPGAKCIRDGPATTTAPTRSTASSAPIRI